MRPVRTLCGNEFVTGVRTSAITYASASTKGLLDHQCRMITDHPATKGLALEHIVRDQVDAVTVDHLVTNVHARGATALLIPADARLAEAQTRLTQDPEPHGAVCVVVGQSPRSTAPQRAERLLDNPPRQRRAASA
jgi:methylphosphotriester-DNA--protein-cysteine methyltransferase